MLDKLQNNTGNGYFSQAVSENAKRMKPEEQKKEESEGKTIGEFSDKEWEKLLDKVDTAIEEYRKDIEQRKEEALEKQQEQAESYILGAGSKEQLEYEQNVMQGGKVYSMRFRKIDDSMFSGEAAENKKPDIADTVSDMISDEAIQQIVGNRGKAQASDEAIQSIVGNRGKAPYSLLANESGEVTYNDVVFQCDYDNNRLCLGDVSNLDDCISVPLENGGCLVVNRDNLDALAKAIGMFSPEDVNRIMRAIAQDAKVRQVKQQIEDETSGMEVLDKKA